MFEWVLATPLYHAKIRLYTTKLKALQLFITEQLFIKKLQHEEKHTGQEAARSISISPVKS